VQIFEEALRTSFRQDHTLCIFKKICGAVPVLEVNGDLYSCDHFVNRDHLLGNITDRSLAEMLDSREQQEFGLKKLNTLPAYCLECEVRDMCNGECPKNRFEISPDGQPGLNYLCPGYKMIFNHIKSFTSTVATVWES
ncbi:MAG TPA: SPASM domain-containing protein, partial [Desulfobacteraceae bacterium]|nr:SPASM domain-containing protein [Desulfobacteraceae bacterium]